MRRTSQASLDAVAAGYEPVLRAAGAEAGKLGEQLFAVVDALDGASTLRRALSDPARDGDAKAALAAGLLAGRADDRVVAVLSAIARARWSAEGDVADAVEQLAADSVLAGAQNAGDLEKVEEEIFRILRLLASQRDLRRALGDRQATGKARAELARSVFGATSHPATAQLLARAAEAPRGRGIVASLTELERLVAARRRKLVAAVTSAQPLTKAQSARLATLLETAYGRSVQLNTSVDADVVGGLRIEVGSDVVNATVLSRIDDVRRRLAG